MKSKMCHLFIKILLFLFMLNIFKCELVVDRNDVVTADDNAISDQVVVITVASDETDGFKRYLRSAQQYGIKPIVLGLGKPWLGGDVTNYPGGGYKVNLLRQHLQQLVKTSDNPIILFTDSYDVIFLSNLDEIVRKFLEMEARIVFSSETSCWPDPKLADQYPIVTGNRYLNSGLFMGYAEDIYKLLDQIEDTDDDQLLYTKAYLADKENIKLDHLNVIFQNLNGVVDQVSVNLDDNRTEVFNTYYDTKPLILHGNGHSKVPLNSLSNYLAKSWNPKDGCIECLERQIDLTQVDPQPIVVIAIFIEHPTPFLEEFFVKIHKLNYPQDRIHLFIHNGVPYHKNVTKTFVEGSGAYLTVKQIFPEDDVKESDARDLGIRHCVNKECQFYFNVDSDAHLDNSDVLKMLISQNRTFVAPMLTRVGKAWSNFWGALSPDGFYSRSFDYMQIAQNERRGLWNVPFISQCYLINSTLWRHHSIASLNYQHKYLDPDMAFCAKMRELNVFMYISNRVDFGHLVNSETFRTDLASPEMYQMFDNRQDWEQRYIHDDFLKSLEEGHKPAQPCPDVYWFPVTKLRFCKDLINIVETFGKWSDGSNYDNRLNTGYEAVPTRDIHMNQVDYETHWLQFLRDYVRPLQESVFTGYYHDPPHSLMNFVVRYRPDEQPSLRPHHDTSTYTINLALNQHGVDYEGGGCRFLRYNCSVVDTKPGWLLMHPGRLTHFHEGLLVTKGTRYIMISFVNP